MLYRYPKKKKLVNVINGSWPVASPVAHTQPSSPDFALLESLPGRSSLELGAYLTTPSAARRWVSALLREWSLEQFEEAAVLITSELVTNSVAEIDKVDWPAARPPIRLWLRGGPALVTVLAWDPIAAVPVPRPAGIADESGRGLFLVEQYSTCWGHYPTEQFGGKVIWARIDRR
jgi:hypothetical protein